MTHTVNEPADAFAASFASKLSDRRLCHAPAHTDAPQALSSIQVERGVRCGVLDVVAKNTAATGLGHLVDAEHARRVRCRTDARGRLLAAIRVEDARIDSLILSDDFFGIRHLT